jgi:putative hydrolase of the HAD superfamily
MLKAVTFDFWNTLFMDVRGREREQRRAEVLLTELRELGHRLPNSAVNLALQTGFDFFDTVWLEEQRTPACGEIVDSILLALGVQFPPDVYAHVVHEYEQMILDLPPEPMPGAGVALRQLASRYDMAVICDTGYSPGSVLRQLLERHHLLAYFKYLYFSNEHGMSKPDPRVFRRTLSELEASPDEGVHIGDIQRTDIAGAQAAGMKAIHFVGANHHDEPRSTGDAIVRRFEDIPSAISALTCARC